MTIEKTKQIGLPEPDEIDFGMKTVFDKVDDRLELLHHTKKSIFETLDLMEDKVAPSVLCDCVSVRALILDYCVMTLDDDDMIMNQIDIVDAYLTGASDTEIDISKRVLATKKMFDQKISSYTSQRPALLTVA